MERWHARGWQAFSDALRQLREERDLSQEGAALKCGIDRAGFGQLESANKTPTLKTAWRVADDFDTVPSELLERAERNQDETRDSQFCNLADEA